MSNKLIKLFRRVLCSWHDIQMLYNVGISEHEFMTGKDKKLKSLKNLR